MASPPSLRTRTGFMNKNDCPQQGTCSLHCPHLCLKVIFPTSSSSPPPPSPSPDDKDQFSSTTSFSPLVIAIIGILATALLLLSYYTLISKYCHRDNNSSGAIEDDPAQGRGRRSRGRRMRRHNNVIHDQTDEFDTDLINSSLHEPWQWHVSLTRGLDESLINSITTYKYRKGEGLVGAGRENCSVCLCEFGEGDCLRLLPKCDHAFHLNCIDTWLTTHSTCPLCRANIFFFGTDNPPHQGDGNEDETQAAGDDDDDMGRVPLSVEQGAEPEGEERNVQRQQEVRRCVSMDHLCQTNGTGNVCGGGNDLRVNEEQEEEEESKDCGCSNSTSNGKLMDTLKRSFSSGRLFYLTRHGNNRVSQNATTSTSNV